MDIDQGWLFKWIAGTAFLVLSCVFIFKGFIMFKAPMTQEDAQSEFHLIAQGFESALIERSPEIALRYGRRDTPQDKFTDISLPAMAAWREVEDSYLLRLKEFPVELIREKPEYITYGLMKNYLESHQRVRIVQEELWSVNAMWGLHILLSDTADKQPLGTPQHRANALKRWNSTSGFIDMEISNLKEGLKQGLTAPKAVVHRVILQLEAMLEVPLESSSFYSLITRDEDPDYQQSMKVTLETNVLPALQRYLDFLNQEYLDRARDEIGLSALPQGEERYKAKLQLMTTLDVEPEQVFRFGLEHMKDIEKEIVEIGQRLFGLNDMREIFKIVKTNSTYKFKNEEAILAYNQAALDRVSRVLDGWFHELPKSPCIIKPYPLHRAKFGAPGEYHPPSDDGETPGMFYINTYQPQEKSRVDHESTLFHELLPGHHLQVGLMTEDKSLLALNRYLWNSGYVEGWALYAERLADEMGLYSDDIARLGMLSNEAMRTARLVVDPGIHVKGWTRDQAVDYMKNHTALFDELVEGEVDRYIALPGQATSYMLGKREIDALRAKSVKVLGDRFNIKDFHHQVLKNGSVTLPQLNEEVNAWLNEQQIVAQKSAL